MLPAVAADLTVPTISLVPPVVHNLDPPPGRLLGKSEGANILRVAHSDRVHLVLVLQHDELRVFDMFKGRMEERAVRVQTPRDCWGYVSTRIAMLSYDLYGSGLTSS